MERAVTVETNSNHRECVARVTIFKPARCNECDAGVEEKNMIRMKKKLGAFVTRILAMFCVADVCLFNIALKIKLN